jgi:hypothetical protein
MAAPCICIQGGSTTPFRRLQCRTHERHEVKETLVFSMFFEVGDTGLEPVTPSLSSKGASIASVDIKALTAPLSGACTAACTSDTDLEQITVELQAVVDAWPSLPESTKAAILAIIQIGGD